MATVTKPIALDESLNTTEQTPRNVADVLAQELARIAGRQASDVEYDNSGSGLSATDVQNALDEIVSDIPTVNDGTLTIQQNGETKGTFTANQSGDSTVNIETPTTGIQTAVDEFSTFNGGLLSECKVALSPIQDLHGYDSPWVGGAGKNKLPNNYTGTGTAGVTAVNNSDGSIKLNGTASTTGYILLNRYEVDAFKDVPLKISINGVNGLHLYVNGIDANNRFVTAVGATTSETTITPTYSNYVKIEVGLQLYNGTTFNGTYYPMVRLASESDSTWQPYSNICPISGHTQVDVGDDGKNLYDPNNPNFPNTIITYNSTLDVNNSFNTWKFEGGHVYTFSYVNGTGFDVLRYGTEVNGVIKRRNATISPTVVDATNIDALYISLGKATDYLSNFQLELGSTATPYVPYNGYQVTVNLGGTYYSGTLDVVSGVFVPNKVGKDMTTITDWNIDTSAQRIYKVLSDIKPTSSGTEIPNIISNGFKAISVNDIYAYVQGVAVSTGSALQFHINGLTDRNDVTLAEVNQWFVNNPTLVVYELANPTPIQLSPTMVKALVGENHLSAPLDGQEITESKYKQMFTFDDVIAYIQSLS